MALVTRCANPACQTLFRVTAAQLQAFSGQVRCGACGTVFDAFPSLTTVADSALRAPGGSGAASGGTAPAGETMTGEVAPSPIPEAAAGGSAAVADTAPTAQSPRQSPGPEAGASGGAGADAASFARPEGASSPRQTRNPQTGAAAADLRAGESATGEAAELTRRVATHSGPQPAAAASALRAEPPAAPQGQGDTTPALPQSADLAREPAAEARHGAPGTDRSAADGRVDTTAGVATRAAAATAPARPVAPAAAPAPTPDTPGAAGTGKGAPGIADSARGTVPAAQDGVAELTDYSVTRGPLPRAVPAAGAARRRLTGLLVLALLGVVALWLARGLLPPPLAAAVEAAGAALGGPDLLREQWRLAAGVLVLLLLLLAGRAKRLWRVMLVLLLGVLAAQTLFAWRTAIAAKVPALRPALEQMCALAGCEVGLPRTAAQLVIEASDLQALDANRPNLIQLSASVRNRASTALAFPAIEVTLTDAQDRPLARRVLLPLQYLSPGYDVRAGVRAGEEFSVKLTLDTTELRPVGYRLYLFYP